MPGAAFGVERVETTGGGRRLTVGVGGGREELAAVPSASVLAFANFAFAFSTFSFAFSSLPLQRSEMNLRLCTFISTFSPTPAASASVAAAASAAAAAPTSLAAAWSCTNFAASTGHPGPDPGLFPDGRGRAEEPDGPEESEPEDLESPEAPDAPEGSKGSRTSAEDLDGGGVGRTGREPGLVPGGTALAESGLALAGVCLTRDTAGASAVASRPR